MRKHGRNVVLCERRQQIIASASANEPPVTEYSVGQVTNEVKNTPISPFKEKSDKDINQQSAPSVTKQSDAMTPAVAKETATFRGAAVPPEDAASNLAETKTYVDAFNSTTESAGLNARTGEPGLVIHTLAKNIPATLRGNDRLEDIIALPKHAIASVYMLAKGARDRDRIRNDRDGRYTVMPMCVTTESQLKPGSFDNTGIISNAIDESGRLDGTLAALKMGLRQSEVPRVSAAVAGYTDGDSHLAVIFHAVSLIFGAQVQPTITPNVLKA
jgi:hypothetical protein